jgi:hypothetical protein
MVILQISFSKDCGVRLADYRFEGDAVPINALSTAPVVYIMAFMHNSAIR